MIKTTSQGTASSIIFNSGSLQSNERSFFQPDSRSSNFGAHEFSQNNLASVAHVLTQIDITPSLTSGYRGANVRASVASSRAPADLPIANLTEDLN